MTKTAINLYSVRDIGESIETVLQRVADAEYDGVQFSGPYGPLSDDPEIIASELDDHGLEVTPPHIGFDLLTDELDDVVPAYEAVGIQSAVIPSLSSDHFASAAAVDAIAEDVNELSEALADYGWDLHYHNHAHEYVDLGDETAFDRFIEATDIGIELDVGWALVGGDDPAARIRSLGERAELIHMKDMDTSVDRGFVEIGEGDVDMEACAEAAAEVDSEWLIYEHDQPEDPATSIDAGAAFLNDL